MVMCNECGWTGSWGDVEYVTVHEDYGDVSCLVCPFCREIDYDGREILEEVGNDGDMV